MHFFLECTSLQVECKVGRTDFQVLLALLVGNTPSPGALKAGVGHYTDKEL